MSARTGIVAKEAGCGFALESVTPVRVATSRARRLNAAR
jgi:hypothetical protein